ncbi:MAG: hypothetical protein ACLVO2_01760 [Clostridia bacterium]
MRRRHLCLCAAGLLIMLVPTGCTREKEGAKGKSGSACEGVPGKKRW